MGFLRDAVPLSRFGQSPLQIIAQAIHTVPRGAPRRVGNDLKARESVFRSERVQLSTDRRTGKLSAAALRNGCGRRKAITQEDNQ